jgi:hypothetical protein
MKARLKKDLILARWSRRKRCSDSTNDLPDINFNQDYNIFLQKDRLVLFTIDAQEELGEQSFFNDENI